MPDQLGQIARGQVFLDIVLLGSGEGNGAGVWGLGILKSTDAGQTWSDISPATPPGACWVWAVNDLIVDAAGDLLAAAVGLLRRSGLKLFSLLYLLLILIPAAADDLKATAEIKGCTNPDISGTATLTEKTSAEGIKEVTVKMHVRGIIRKLGARNRTQAAKLLGITRRGLIYKIKRFGL